MEKQWDGTYDVVVVGSGAAGFTAAITARKQGLSVLLIEKTERYGGSTALSGGAIWVPNNDYLKEAGLKDSLENARIYLDETVGDSSPSANREAYLTRGPEMVRFLRENTHVKWTYVKGYSDYYPNLPGGKAEGRSIEAKLFNLKRLGESLKNMRRSELPTQGMVVRSIEFYKVNMFTRTLNGIMTALKVGLRLIRTKLSLGRYAPSALGEALVGRLMLSYKEIGGELWLSSPFRELIYNERCEVAGITVEKEGKLLRIKAEKGVVFGSGGFSHNQFLREKYLPKPTNSKWTLSSKGQTGDFLTEAEKAGAVLKVMDRVWGSPTALLPGMPPYMAVADRAVPGTIIVDQKGKRYINECAPYHEFVDTMYLHNKKKNADITIPSWYIFDKRVKSRYLVFGTFPRTPVPRLWIDTGIVKEAPTLVELAEKMGVPVENFMETVMHFNGFARKGVDEAFYKGGNAYDRFYGDPTLPNPNLAPIDKAPYYALPLYPGDIGTKGGPQTDEHGRVIRIDGTPIKGLYAAGNCAASVMGNTYPGPGATIGSAMVFGYISAMHIAQGK